MPGKIHTYDTYDLRKYCGNREVTTFVDFGAAIGTTSILARMLLPFARIIAIEPRRTAFQRLRRIANWGIECHRFALGDGEPLKSVSRMQFLKDEQAARVNKTTSYEVLSKTLSQTFEDLRIDTAKPFIVKIDVEGGELYLLDDKPGIEILQKAIQINLEYHPRIAGNGEIWNPFFDKFRQTHVILRGGYVGRKQTRFQTWNPMPRLQQFPRRTDIQMVMPMWLRGR